MAVSLRSAAMIQRTDTRAGARLPIRLVGDQLGGHLAFAVRGGEHERRRSGVVEQARPTRVRGLNWLAS